MTQFVVGQKYNWIGSPVQLVYMGEIQDSSGFWHQFCKVGDPGKVWCEVRARDLNMLEETKE